MQPGPGEDGAVTSETEVAGRPALERPSPGGEGCVRFLPLAEDLWLAGALAGGVRRLGGGS